MSNKTIELKLGFGFGMKCFFAAFGKLPIAVRVAELVTCGFIIAGVAHHW